MQVSSWTSEQNIKAIVSSKIFENCKNENCNNADCKKKHDLVTEKRLHNLLKRKKCRFGVDCKSPICRFLHPPGYLPISERECQHGLNCHNKKCGYRHPKGERKTKNEMPCRFGIECHKLGCQFAHPPEREERLQALIDGTRKKPRVQNEYQLPNSSQPPPLPIIYPNSQYGYSTMHPSPYAAPSPYNVPSHQFPPIVAPHSYESRVNFNAPHSTKMVDSGPPRSAYYSQHHQEPTSMRKTVQKTSLQHWRSVDNRIPHEQSRKRKRRRDEIDHRTHHRKNRSILTSKYRRLLDERKQRHRDQISYAPCSPDRKYDSDDEMLHVPAIHGMGLEEAYDFPAPDGVPAENMIKQESRESVWPEVHPIHPASTILCEMPPLEKDI